jgi:hypothetical protein
MESVVDGFNGLELLGILELKSADIRHQLAGTHIPDVEYKRKVLLDDPCQKAYD